MRLLVDVHGLDLGRGVGDRPAATIAYTNHTLLPEALESWPVPLFGTAAAAPHADHLSRSTRRFLRRGCAQRQPTTSDMLAPCR
jgi:glucan phosphorylase